MRGRHRKRPPQTASTGFSKIQTPVDEDAREPHLEGVFLSIARDMREHFYECVLHCFVCVMRITQVAVGNADSTPLMLRDEVSELLPRALAIAREHERLETGRQRRVP
jgi:hypothetical protein